MAPDKKSASDFNVRFRFLCLRTLSPCSIAFSLNLSLSIILITFHLRLITLLGAVPWDTLKTWSRTIPCQSHHPHGRRPSHHIVKERMLFATRLDSESSIPISISLIYFNLSQSILAFSTSIFSTQNGLGGGTA